MQYRKKLSSQLPPTPCTEEMRTKVVGIAKDEGVSIADVIRNAISLFLARYDSNAIKENPQAYIEEQAS